MSRYGYRVIPILLIGFMAVRLFASIMQTALITDEFVHIPAGYVYLKAQRFDFNPEHPPLIKMLSALPLLILNPPLPEDPRHVKDWSRWFKFCMDFFQQAGSKSRQLIIWSRVPMIFVSCLLAWLVFAWAKKAYGIVAGLFSVLLYTMEPNIFAHSRLVYTDIGASLAYLVFFYCVWRCVEAPIFRNVLLVIFAASIAPLIKHSMVITLPLWIVVWAGLMFAGKIPFKKGLLYAAATVLIFLLTLNLTYGLQTHAFNSRDLNRVAAWFDLNMSGSFLNSYLDHHSIIPVPADYLIGLDDVVKHNRFGHPAFLLGQFSSKGWWYYFPVAFGVKAPIPFILLTLGSLGWLIMEVLVRKNGSAVFLLIPILLYCAISMPSHIDIGIRHLLPIFPFLIVSSGGLLQFLWERRHMLRWFVLALGICMAINSLAIRYDPLEYFNELAGGPENGWRYLGESNTEGGESFFKIAEFLRSAGTRNVYMYLVGVDYALFRGMDFNLFLPTTLGDNFRKQFPFDYQQDYSSIKPGVYLISVSRMLDPESGSTPNQADLDRRLSLRRFLTIQPRAKIGHAVWVYDLAPEYIERLHLSDMHFFYLNHVQYRRSD